MPKRLKVEKTAFDRILRKLAHSTPVKRDEVKIDARKPAKVIPPSEPHN